MSRRPRSLYVGESFTDEPPENGPLSEDDAHALASKVMQFANGGDMLVSVASAQNAWTELAHDQVTDASDTRFTSVDIVITDGPRSASVTTNHLDDDSLHAAVMQASTLVQQEHLGEQTDDEPLDPPAGENPALWHDATIEIMQPHQRLDVMQQAINSIDANELTASGYVGVSARSIAVLTSSGHFEYARITSGECSISARTTDNTASGWAAWKGEDWALADPQALATRAADVAHHSRFPVAVEPGRYTVVLSPVAVAELIGGVMRGAFDGRSADEGRSPFSRENGTTALGTKVFSDHVNISADPGDTDGGFFPFVVAGRSLQQYQPVTWVRDGVLTTLAYDGPYARQHNKTRVLNSGAFRMRGDDVSLDDLIGAIDRGIYINRFSDVTTVPRNRFVLTGVTRDGLFLIEQGKITRALRNMRFQASPFQILSSVTTLGKSERVPVSGPPIVAPAMVVNDFLFTATTEAV